ncbi:hypothetical protein F5Y12DRAFT_523446 [Xylaria sp. FL1777]|nr:hypothetical protein F5Y12DRAFT_523446 [Xylaria sp. FL1777]
MISSGSGSSSFRPDTMLTLLSLLPGLIYSGNPRSDQLPTHLNCYLAFDYDSRTRSCIDCGGRRGAPYFNSYQWVLSISKSVGTETTRKCAAPDEIDRVKSKCHLACRGSPPYVINLSLSSKS